MDLLRLARTSKDLRRLLMNRNSAHIWKTVIQDMEDIPDCPNDMSPPAYVHLLYHSMCHVRLSYLLSVSVLVVLLMATGRNVAKAHARRSIGTAELAIAIAARRQCKKSVLSC